MDLIFLLLPLSSFLESMTVKFSVMFTLSGAKLDTNCSLLLLESRPNKTQMSDTCVQLMQENIIQLLASFTLLIPASLVTAKEREREREMSKIQVVGSC